MTKASLKSSNIQEHELNSVCTLEVSCQIILQGEPFFFKFQCCGFHLPQDWKNATYYNSSAAVPVSCCVDMTESGCNSAFNSTAIYQQVHINFSTLFQGERIVVQCSIKPWLRQCIYSVFQLYYMRFVNIIFFIYAYTCKNRMIKY